jgi:hypothetical protein
MDGFLELHRRGQMAVVTMQFHWTPMLSTAGMRAARMRRTVEIAAGRLIHDEVH